MAAAGRPARPGGAAGGGTRPADPAIAAASEKLKQISLRMDDLAAELASCAASGRRPRGAELHKELCYLMRITLESPATLRRRMARTHVLACRL